MPGAASAANVRLRFWHSPLDFYLSGNFPQEVLYERKERLESAVQSLESGRESETAQLEQTITDTQIEELKDLAGEIAEGLSEADEDVKTRRRMLDYLSVKVVFAFEQGTEGAELTCEFGLDKRVSSEGKRRSTSRTPSRQPESGSSASSRAGGAGNCGRGNRRNRDTMLGNKPKAIKLDARIIYGQAADGTSLAQALFAKVGDLIETRVG